MEEVEYLEEYEDVVLTQEPGVELHGASSLTYDSYYFEESGLAGEEIIEDVTPFQMQYNTFESVKQQSRPSDQFGDSNLEGDDMESHQEYRKKSADGRDFTTEHSYGSVNDADEKPKQKKRRIRNVDASSSDDEEDFNDRQENEVHPTKKVTFKEKENKKQNKMMKPGGVKVSVIGSKQRSIGNSPKIIGKKSGQALAILKADRSRKDIQIKLGPVPDIFKQSSERSSQSSSFSNKRTSTPILRKKDLGITPNSDIKRKLSALAAKKPLKLFKAPIFRRHSGQMRHPGLQRRLNDIAKGMRESPTLKKSQEKNAALSLERNSEELGEAKKKLDRLKKMTLSKEKNWRDSFSDTDEDDSTDSAEFENSPQESRRLFSSTKRTTLEGDPNSKSADTSSPSHKARRIIYPARHKFSEYYSSLTKASPNHSSQQTLGKLTPAKRKTGEKDLSSSPVMTLKQKLIRGSTLLKGRQESVIPGQRKVLERDSTNSPVSSDLQKNRTAMRSSPKDKNITLQGNGTSPASVKRSPGDTDPLSQGSKVSPASKGRLVDVNINAKRETVIPIKVDTTQSLSISDSPLTKPRIMDGSKQHSNALYTSEPVNCNTKIPVQLSNDAKDYNNKNEDAVKSVQRIRKRPRIIKSTPAMNSDKFEDIKRRKVKVRLKKHLVRDIFEASRRIYPKETTNLRAYLFGIYATQVGLRETNQDNGNLSSARQNAEISPGRQKKEETKETVIKLQKPRPKSVTLKKLKELESSVNSSKSEQITPQIVQQQQSNNAKQLPHKTQSRNIQMNTANLTPQMRQSGNFNNTAQKEVIPFPATLTVHQGVKTVVLTPRPHPLTESAPATQSAGRKVSPTIPKAHVASPQQSVASIDPLLQALKIDNNVIVKRVIKTPELKNVVVNQVLLPDTPVLVQCSLPSHLVVETKLLSKDEYVKKNLNKGKLAAATCTVKTAQPTATRTPVPAVSSRVTPEVQGKDVSARVLEKNDVSAVAGVSERKDVSAVAGVSERKDVSAVAVVSERKDVSAVAGVFERIQRLIDEEVAREVTRNLQLISEGFTTDNITQPKPKQKKLSPNCDLTTANAIHDILKEYFNAETVGGGGVAGNPSTTSTKPDGEHSILPDSEHLPLGPSTLPVHVQTPSDAPTKVQAASNAQSRVAGKRFYVTSANLRQINNLFYASGLKRRPNMSRINKSRRNKSPDYFRFRKIRLPSKHGQLKGDNTESSKNVAKDHTYSTSPPSRKVSEVTAISVHSAQEHSAQINDQQPSAPPALSNALQVAAGNGVRSNTDNCQVTISATTAQCPQAATVQVHSIIDSNTSKDVNNLAELIIPDDPSICEEGTGEHSGNITSSVMSDQLSGPSVVNASASTSNNEDEHSDFEVVVTRTIKKILIPTTGEITDPSDVVISDVILPDEPDVSKVTTIRASQMPSVNKTPKAGIFIIGDNASRNDETDPSDVDPQYTEEYSLDTGYQFKCQKCTVVLSSRPLIQDHVQRIHFNTSKNCYLCGVQLDQPHLLQHFLDSHSAASISR